MDDGLLNKPVDDSQASDDTQSKVDEALNSLPGDLEKPVTPTTTDPISTPITPPATPTLEPEPSLPPLPPLPPLPTVEEPKPEMPEVEEEKVEEIKPPKRKTGKAVKFVGGVLMLALLVGGGWYGSSMLKNGEEVESMASTPANKWNPGDVEISSSGKTMYVAVVDKDTGETKVKTMNTANTEIDDAMEDGRNSGGRVNFNLNEIVNLDSKATVDSTGKIIATASTTTEKFNNTGNEAVLKVLSDNLSAVSESGKNNHEGTALNANIDSRDTVEVWVGNDITKDGMISKDDGAKYFQVSYAEALALVAIYGSVQIDGNSNSVWATYIDGDCSGPLCDPVEESPNPSTPPPSSPLPNYACVGLTGDAVYEYGTTETFTCTATFSAVNPVAFFQYNVDGGTYNTSAAVALSGTTASYDIPIDEYGAWEVQCRICTDSTATSCTAWGNAN